MPDKGNARVGMPKLASAKPKIWGGISDKDNDLVDKAMDIGGVDKDQLSVVLARRDSRFEICNVSREEFDNWRYDKEEIGGFERIRQLAL
jgi:hypothetical protein